MQFNGGKGIEECSFHVGRLSMMTFPENIKLRRKSNFWYDHKNVYTRWGEMRKSIVKPSSFQMGTVPRILIVYITHDIPSCNFTVEYIVNARHKFQKYVKFSVFCWDDWLCLFSRKKTKKSKNCSRQSKSVKQL